MKPLTLAMRNMLRDLVSLGPLTSTRLDVRGFGPATKSALFKRGLVSRHTPQTPGEQRTYTISDAGTAALQERK